MGGTERATHSSAAACGDQRWIQTLDADDLSPAARTLAQSPEHQVRGSLASEAVIAAREVSMIRGGAGLPMGIFSLKVPSAAKVVVIQDSGPPSLCHGSPSGIIGSRLAF